MRPTTEASMSSTTFLYQNADVFSLLNQRLGTFIVGFKKDFHNKGTGFKKKKRSHSREIF